MAEPQRRSTDDESTEHEHDDTDATASQDDTAVRSEGTISETDAPDGQTGLGDAPDVEPRGESDLAQADPRSAQTAGATDTPGGESEPGDADVDDADGDADGVAAASGTKKQKKSPGAEPATGVKAKKDPDETASGSTRSGNPARKAAADKKTKKSSGRVSRTPAKPKVIGNRWAAPLMLASAGIGLAWIVVFYVTQDRIEIPWYSDLGSWNLVIGMGFIVAAFGFAMKWE